jgi:hypothetical protein
MEGVKSHANVELVLAAVLDQVFVAANTSSLEGLGRQLLVLVGHKVDAEREVLHAGLLPAQIEDSDLGIGDTATETRLGVRLVFTIPITGNKALD